MLTQVAGLPSLLADAPLAIKQHDRTQDGDP